MPSTFTNYKGFFYTNTLLNKSFFQINTRLDWVVYTISLINENEQKHYQYIVYGGTNSSELKRLYFK